MTEILDVVNEEDKVVGRETRQAIVESALLHRASHIILMNSQGEYFVQKRSEKKDMWPGMHEIGVGERLQAGETYEIAAKRGLFEETGLRSKITKLFTIKVRSAVANENIEVYKAVTDEDIKFNDTEMEECTFVSEKELRTMLPLRKFTPATEIILERYFNEVSQNKRG